MIDYVIMPKADYQALCDAIRAKSGKTGAIKSGDLQTEIMTLPSGGSSDDVRYVTFMNGNQFLFRKPVATGDDCVDVEAKDIIPTPTKESDVQYDYTYYGWGASDGGAVDADILKNITEDKTVYAIYTSTLRSYMVTYLDDDGVTVLYSEPLLYGTIPSYVPRKAGYIFESWSTTPVEVTGDVSYIAVWTEAMGSGTCGTNATWTLDKAGVLTISGTGSVNQSPWSEYTGGITKVVVESGITALSCNFKNCTMLTEVTIPNTVTSIGSGILSGCSSLESLSIPFVGMSYNPNTYKYPLGIIFGTANYDGAVAATQTFIGSTNTSTTSMTFYIPSSLKTVTVTGNYNELSQYAFNNITGLQLNVILTSIKVVSNYAFQNCSALVSVTLPNTCTMICAGAFKSCTKLSSITIPASVTKIQMYAFSSAGLTSMTFEDTSSWYSVYNTTSPSSGGTYRSVTNPTTNATMFKNTYAQYGWYKT